MIIELKYNSKKYTAQKDIHKILFNNEFYWLIDSETNNAVIEIENNTIIWHSGDYLSGNWYYGIFKSGNFYGNWENGIFEGDNFKGNWKSGVNLLKK